MQQLPYTQAQKQYTKAQEQNSSNDVTVSEHQNTLLAISHDKKSDINFNADDAQTISNNIEAVRAHINHNREAGTQIIKCTLPGDGHAAYVEIDPKSLYVVGFDIYENGKLKVDEQPQTSVRVKDSSNQSNIKNGSKSDTRVGRTKIPQNQGQKKEEKQAKQEKIEYIDSKSIAYKNGTKAQFSSKEAHDLLDAFGTRIAESIRFDKISDRIAKNFGKSPDGAVDFTNENVSYYLHHGQQNPTPDVQDILPFSVSSEPDKAMKYSDLIDNWSKLSKQTTLCEFIQNKVKQKDSSNSKDQSTNEMIQQKQIKGEEQRQVGLVQQANNFLSLKIVTVPHIKYKDDIKTLSEFFKVKYETTNGISQQELLIKKYQEQINKIGDNLSEEQFLQLNSAIRSGSEQELKTLLPKQVVQRDSKPSLEQQIQRLEQDVQNLNNVWDNTKCETIGKIFNQKDIKDQEINRALGLMIGHTEQLKDGKQKIDLILQVLLDVEKTLQQDKVQLEEKKNVPSQNAQNESAQSLQQRSQLLEVTNKQLQINEIRKNSIKANAKKWLEDKLSNYSQTLEDGLKRDSIPEKVKSIIKIHKDIIAKLQSAELLGEQWYEEQQTKLGALRKELKNKSLQKGENQSQQDLFKNGGNEKNASVAKQSSTSQLTTQEQLKEQLKKLVPLQQLLKKQPSNNQLQKEFKKYQKDCEELQKMVDHLPKALIQTEEIFTQLFTPAKTILTAYKQYKQQQSQQDLEQEQQQSSQLNSSKIHPQQQSTISVQKAQQPQKNATQSVAKKASWWNKWKWGIIGVGVAGLAGYLYGHKNLKRDEKEKLKANVTTDKHEYNFYAELINANSETQKKNLAGLTAIIEQQTKDTIPPHNQQGGAINKDKEVGKVALMAEKYHSVDHKTNVKELVGRMERGEMGAKTVVALERKEGGDNLGMRDVRLLAEVLQHNEGCKNAEKIALPAGVEGTALWWDAKLVNEAQKHGVRVVGVEGKGLAHGQHSSEYNADREDHMAQQLARLAQQGYNVVMPVGEAHVQGLQSRLSANAAIDAMHNITQQSGAQTGLEKGQNTSPTTLTTKKIYGKFTEHLAGGSSQDHSVA